MVLNHCHADTLLLGLFVSVLLSCSGGPSGPRSGGWSNDAGMAGSGPAWLGLPGNETLDGGWSSGSPGSGQGSAEAGSTDRDSAEFGGGGRGAPETGSGSGAPFGEGASGTDDTYDYGKSGTGGTMDLGGVGGTLDTGMGGSLDMGTGGSLDLGAGGTLDTCIPSCTPDLLGVGEKAVNLVVFENAQASGCDTEGRMWVGGNASLDGYGVGHQLKTCDAKDPVLVVGGDLHVDGGIKGSIWVGGSWDESTRVRPECGAILSDKPGPVDFAFVEAQLTAYSRLLASYPANGTTSTQYGSLIFEGTDKQMNIFSVDGADLAAANGLSIKVPRTSTVIINVTGASAAFNNGTEQLPDGVTCGSGAVKLDDFCNQIVWNMPNAKEVEVQGTAVQGTILAPQATLSGSAQVNGTVIIRNLLLRNCVEMHPHYFNGCLCTKEVSSKYACCPK